MNKLMINVVTVAGEVVVATLLLMLVRFIVRRIIGRLGKLGRFKRGVEVLDQNVRLLFALFGVLAVLALVGLNAWLIWRGEYLPRFSMKLLESVPLETWIKLGIAAGKVVGVMLLALIVLRPVRRLLSWLCERAKAYESIRANDEAVEHFFNALTRMASRGTWLAVLLFASHVLWLPKLVQYYIGLALKLYLIAAAGLALWRGLDAIIESVDALSKKYSSSENLLRYYDKLTHLVPLFRRAVEYALYTAVAYLITLQLEMHSIAAWGPRILKIIGVVFLARVAVELSNLIVEEVLITRATLSDEQLARRKTIMPLVRSGFKYGIYFSGAILVLKQIGVDPAPILAGAGIIGLAVGFGAQALINDIVSGFFILFENHYLVGDYVKAGNAEGEVEAIDLRTTRIRDFQGSVHILRNGKIENVINFSKEYAVAIVKVGVAYGTDLEHAYKVLRDVGEKLVKEHEDVLAPLEVHGVSDLGDSAVTIRTGTRVRPGKHGGVERLLRRLIKEAFEREGISIPFPQRVVQLAAGSTLPGSAA
ncbi:MAG: mechanosensitive ion channel family protein [Myxococcales bacterium]|nr:mechanosensitive ion channel family protein [Myxococcales bacterium]